MKKLKNKIFLTIFTILTFSILTVLFIFNSQDYIREKNNIMDNLSRMNFNKEMIKPNYSIIDKPNIDLNDDRRFMDANIYTIVLDSDNNITDIISHTNDGTIPSEITNVASNIIKNNNDKTYIGNLYFNGYSYKLINNNSLILIDNCETNSRLRTSFVISIIIFIIFEVIAFLIASVISKWIIKPVENSFNKQKQFIADASHELKTPLSVIMASAEALENDSNKKWLYNIQNESERMNKLIKDLLDLAKLENENIKRQFEENNLSKIIEMSVLTLESLMYEKDIKLEYNIDENIYLKSNSDEMKQLISILLDNAIKHSDKDGNIIVNLKKAKDDIILEVINKGNPIPSGEEEKIFERFYRVDKSRNRNENRYGLGLAIAKNIVINHNGKINAYSKDGYTTFMVNFKKK